MVFNVVNLIFYSKIVLFCTCTSIVKYLLICFAISVSFASFLVKALFRFTISLIVLSSIFSAASFFGNIQFIQHAS